MRKLNVILGLLAFIFFICASLNQIQGQIVINEVYGGGGNAGAAYDRDFIELYNNGGAAVNLTGYTLWYASAAGVFNNSVPLSGTISAGGHFLVATTSAGANGAMLPTPNLAATSPNLSATNGNVILTDPTFTGMTGFACPPGGTTGVLDRLGYGTGNCPETTASSPGTNALSLTRNVAGLDTNNNSTDFSAVAPTPQAAGPSAAAGSVAGRVTDFKGNGLKFVMVMISGGDLPEPLYATTNNFGWYRFEDLPVGENYVLTVFSRKYQFEQTSLVINLKDSITEADFIGSER